MPTVQKWYCGAPFRGHTCEASSSEEAIRSAAEKWGVPLVGTDSVRIDGQVCRVFARPL